MTERLRELSRDECLQMLQAHSVGRIAVTHQALPVIIPVNYVVDGNTIVFRTRREGILGRACRSAVVAFEIDDIADDGQSGSSVVVVGVADLLDSSEQLRLLHSGPASALADQADQFVRITPGTVTGRQVLPVSERVPV